MVESAMKKKLNIRPLVGFLQHSAFWEGPCRAGKFENLQPEAEKVWADNYMKEINKEMTALNIDKYEDLEKAAEVLADA